MLIDVQYSSLNYKDALSATGNKGVTRNYPHTPGIDAVGVIELSNDNSLKVGDKVIVIAKVVMLIPRLKIQPALMSCD